MTLNVPPRDCRNCWRKSFQTRSTPWKTLKRLCKTKRAIATRDPSGWSPTCTKDTPPTPGSTETFKTRQTRQIFKLSRREQNQTWMNYGNTVSSTIILQIDSHLSIYRLFYHRLNLSKTCFLAGFEIVGKDSLNWLSQSSNVQGSIWYSKSKCDWPI